MSDTFLFSSGQLPLLVSVPHSGTLLANGLQERLTPEAIELPDTDWYVDRLLAGVASLGVAFIVARYSRYVIDLNRPPDNAPLYDSATPGLVPLQTFAGEPVYLEGREPDADEVERRRDRFWDPYHRVIDKELRRLAGIHGYAMLLDAHSIPSRVPSLFDGRLPDLNLGSNNGRSASPSLVRVASKLMNDHPEFTSVTDGRFRGGYITRHHGRPDQGIHALQMEMSQDIYMDGPRRQWNELGAGQTSAFLCDLVRTMLDWGASRA